MEIDMIIEELKRIIEDIADISADEINGDNSMIDDLDLSSLEIMSIISEVEKKFPVKISEDEMLSISTVEELAEIIGERSN